MSKTILTGLLFFCLGMSFTFCQSKVKLFLDCRTGCDLNYFRQAVPYVDYVRDQNLADIHLLVTGFRTASGGRQYDLSFIGLKDFEGLDQMLNYQALPGAPSDKVRKGMARQIKLGLINYLMKTPLASSIEVKVKMPKKQQQEELSLDDPWKHWVFETSLNGNMSLQKSRRTYNLRAGLEINQVTEAWRIVQQSFYNLNLRNFINDEETITSKLERYGISGRVVKSIDNHWSAGLFEGVSASTFNNLDIGLSIGPALEYSIYPYNEVTFREPLLILTEYITGII